MSIYTFKDKNIENWQRPPGLIAMTNGVFDILHRGHVEYLVEASKKADHLIVGVNSDSSVRMLGKGPDRPHIGEMDRAFIISQLKAVTDVIIFSEKTPVDLVGFLKPDVFVKGADYKIEDLPEAEVVFSYGGRVELIDLSKGYSTTSIVSNIRSS